MAETTNNVSLDDFIVVELSSKQLGKTSLRGLDTMFLPISEDGKVTELENEIYDLSSYVSKISSDFAASTECIEELDAKFEKKSDTDYILVDPNILTVERIETLLSGKTFATIDELDSKFEDILDNITNAFDETNTNVDDWIDNADTDGIDSSITEDIEE